MFLRVCYNKPEKSLTLKSAAAEIFEEELGADDPEVGKELDGAEEEE